MTDPIHDLAKIPSAGSAVPVTVSAGHHPERSNSTDKALSQDLIPDVVEVLQALTLFTVRAMRSVAKDQRDGNGEGVAIGDLFDLADERLEGMAEPILQAVEHHVRSVIHEMFADPLAAEGSEDAAD